MRRRAFPLLATLAALLGSPALGAVARTGQPVMGTVLEVTVVAAEEATARRLAEEAVAEARRWEEVLTTWRPEGELARLNAHAGRGRVVVSPALRAVLERMQELTAATAGAFDPTIGGVVRLWRGAKSPAAGEFEALGPVGIAGVLALDAGGARLAAGAELDAGGIGKGIALDAIVERLRAGGAEAAFVDFGGSSQLALSTRGQEYGDKREAAEPPRWQGARLRRSRCATPQGAQRSQRGWIGGRTSPYFCPRVLSGAPGAEHSWRVAVAGLEAGVIHGTVSLRDGVLSTSRASGPGDEAGPIVDPRTRRPVKERRVATVLGHDATAADAWSTALVVLGRAGLEAARRHGLEALIEDEEGLVRTPSFPLEEPFNELRVPPSP